MGKNIQCQSPPHSITALRQHLRHSSLALQRHIFQADSLKIKQFLNQSMKNHQISFQTHEKYMDLLRQTAKQRQLHSKNAQSSDTSDKDSDQERKQIHKNVSLPDQFEVLLDKSLVNYERTYELFKKMSLLQKYGHLVGLCQQHQEKTNPKALTQNECRALRKIKIIYRRYKVSNMYRSSISSRIRKRYIETLIEKGYLKEKNQILSLTT